jgi:hypothetical protein
MGTDIRFRDGHQWSDGCHLIASEHHPLPSQ